MNTPFIIKKKPFKTLLPADSEVYDEAQETRIQILQAANGYLAVLYHNKLDQHVI